MLDLKSLKKLSLLLRAAADAIDQMAYAIDRVPGLAMLYGIKESSLSVRSRHACEKLGLESAFDLSRMSEEQMQKHAGITATNEMSEWLATMGLTFSPTKEVPNGSS